MSNIYFCGNKSNFSQFSTVTPNEIIDYFYNKPQLSGDTETKGKDPHSKRILSLQLGDKDTQFVIDVRSVNILLFKDLLEAKLSLWHNAGFDYKFLLSAGIRLNNVYDTMLSEVVIFNGIETREGFYGLRGLAKRHLKIELEKDTRGDFFKLTDEPFTDKQIQYAGLDVAYLDLIKERQSKYIKHYDIQPAIDLENRAVVAFSDIEYNGLYLDQKDWVNVSIKKELKLKELEIVIDEYLISNNIFQAVNFGVDLFDTIIRKLNINYSSNQQVKDLLHKCNIIVEDTNDRTLQKEKSYKIVQLILEHRELAKKVSTYGKKFLKYINKSTGRVHTEFWQVKNTFRVGSGNKKSNAPNIQNIPASNEYRNCFKARNGFSFVSIDYSSQELRVMADYSREYEIIDALKRGDDLHCFAYGKMTGEVITKKDKEKRTKAKTINFGKAYGMSHFKLADQLDIPVSEAEDLFDKYSKAFPKLNTWLDQQYQFGNKKGYILTNPIHKGRRWFNIKDKKNKSWKEIKKLEGTIGRASMNTPIQGTSAVMVKEALVNIRNWLIENAYWNKDIFMIGTIHDEINFEIKTELVETVVPVLENIMIATGNKYVTTLEMEVESTINTYWEKD